MASVAGAFAVGAIFLLLGCYLTFGPLFADTDVSETQTGVVQGFALPGWFYFPVGITTQVSWSEMSASDTVTARPCDSVTNGHCVGGQPAVGSGTGESGSFTFTAAEGQTYGVNTTGEGVLSIEVQYTGVYGVLLFIVWTAGVVGIALGVLYNHQRGSRYSAI